MAEKPQEKIEDVVNKTFAKGSHKALIAGDVLAKYRDSNEELSKEYREDLIKKYTQSKDTPAKSRKRVADVISKLRKAGYYEDSYSRGEKTAVGAKKTALEKAPSIKIHPDPSKPPLDHSSTIPSTRVKEGSVEDDGKNKIVSTPPKLENRSDIDSMADELDVDPRDLQAFMEARRREKTKSEEARIQEVVDQRLKQLLNTGNPTLTGNPGNSSPPPISDADKLREAVGSLSPAELRQQLRKKTGGVENPMLTAFQYMDSELSIVDIMDELNLDFDTITDYQDKFNKMKALELERQQLTEPYLKAWFDIAAVLGEDMRRNCSHFNEVSGVCDYWRLDEISETYRKTYSGLYRSAGKKKGGYYINVDRHPEVCAVCSLGMMKKEGGV